MNQPVDFLMTDISGSLKAKQPNSHKRWRQRKNEVVPVSWMLNDMIQCNLIILIAQRSDQNTSGTNCFSFCLSQLCDASFHLICVSVVFTHPQHDVAQGERVLTPLPMILYRVQHFFLLSINFISTLFSQTKVSPIVLLLPGSLAFPMCSISPSTSQRTLDQRAPGSTTSV